MRSNSSHSVNGINFSVNVKKVKGVGYYVVNFRDLNGRQIQRSTGFKSDDKNYGKALKRAKEIVSEFASQNGQDNSDRKLKSDMNSRKSAKTQKTAEEDGILLNDYILSWIHRSKQGISTTTYDNYLSMFKCHIEPYFKGFKLTDLKPMHLQEYINKTVQNISPNTVCKHISMMGTAMKDAYINDLIPSNPVDKIQKPKKNKAKTDYYTIEELRTLLAASRGTVLEAPVFIAAMFGLRRSEVVGLRWCDIDLDRKTLTVNGSVTRSNIDGKWTDVFSDTLKTEASHGTFKLNDEVCEYFQKLRERNMSLISNVDDYKEFVCVNEIGERLKVDFVTHKFSKLLKENNLRHIRFHDLRHSILTYLAKHFTPKTVQGYARHANCQTTLDIYCHSDENDTQAELNCFCSALDFGESPSQALQETCRKNGFGDAFNDA